jgi:hypothetical protein
VRVRMLHSTVRTRIAAKKGSEFLHLICVSIADGRDMIATLGSFAIAPLWSLRRLGITLTDEEELAYVSAWRHIG